MRRPLTALIGLLLLLPLLPSAHAGPWEEAEKNAADSRRAIRLARRLAHGWLEYADPQSGLLPRRLDRDLFWNAKDSAADNFPFLLLTAHVTDSRYLKQATAFIFSQEQRLTNRLDSLPDDYLFETQAFRPGDYDIDALIFGASEYAKDGLIPITEQLGAGPWLERMRGLLRDIYRHAPYRSPDGPLPSRDIEVNGELLQVMSRLYWITGEEQWRRRAFRLADLYLLRENLLDADAFQLDDHGCEIIGGLAEAYVIAAETDPERRRRYRAPLHAILDSILEHGRNADGLLYHTFNPRTGEIVNRDLTDNWGYDYNAFLTVARLDGVKRYRDAVEHVLANLHKYVDYPWEGGGADGYADSIEGAINLLNRIPVESAFEWTDRSMEILLAKQGEDGIIEGWYGDGNSARTALMYALWKTRGITASPWREDLELGAALDPEGGIAVFLKSRRPWRGRLRFDRKRHRVNLRLPFDYPRINQFPEWSPIEEEAQYEIERIGGATERVSGERLLDWSVALEAEEPLRLRVRPAPRL